MYMHILQKDKALRPFGLKRRRRRSTPSFCQKLAQDLDRADYIRSPTYCQRYTKHNNSQSPLVRLPAELRQEILYNTMDDDDLLSPSEFGRVTTDLSLLCKTSYEDVKIVAKRWRAERFISQQDRDEHRVFWDVLFAEYKTSIKNIALMSCAQRPRSSKRARFYQTGRQRKKEDAKIVIGGKTASYRSRYPEAHWHGKPFVFKQWAAPSQQMREETEVWRAIRRRKKVELESGRVSKKAEIY